MNIFEAIYRESRKEENLDYIINLNKKLNTYEFGVPFNPNPEDIDHEEDYYSSLTMEEMDHYKMGTCWDFTHYYCRDAQKRRTHYQGILFACFNDEDGTCLYTHAIPLLEINDHTFWAESAWERYKGLYEFETRIEALTYAFNLWKEETDEKCKDKSINYGIFRYRAGLEKYEELDCKSFILNICCKTGIEISQSALLDSTVEPLETYN